MRYGRLAIFILLVLASVSCSEDSSGLAGSEGTGRGGSMTRFAINGDYLYVVNNQHILVYRTSTFEKLDDVPISIGLETIFAKGDYLYLGANDAMYIYSIANPAKPSFVFRYSHIVSCDPVVVQGNRAYVTLRSGSECNRGANALEIIDITNPNNPTLIANYPMTSPHGLGVRGNYLFICEGDAGLKVFDISNETNIVLLKHINSFFAMDVIVDASLITVTGEDGIFQFEYPVPGDVLRQVSKIAVEREEL